MIANGEGWTLIQGDCPAALAELADNSVDSVVTDPPYGLSDHDAGDIAEALACWLRGDVYTHDKRGFMGKAWDGFVPGPDVWREVYRVLKPGGHLVCFAGSRTHDLMGIAIRLAGFELRDTINHASTPHYLGWVQGQGFPKSLDVSKAIDKAAGVEREDLGPHPYNALRGNGNPDKIGFAQGGHLARITAPATPDAQRWEGWHTALKPALEPILLFRKPLAAPTVAANVLEHGTGAINVDACRVGTNAGRSYPNGRGGQGWHGRESLSHNLSEPMSATQGRWPSNLVLSHSVGCVKVGRKRVVGSVSVGRNRDGSQDAGTYSGGYRKDTRDITYADPDGMEEVDAWECVDGCPVKALDEQAGERKSGGFPSRHGIKNTGYDDAGVYGTFRGADTGREKLHASEGSASRFFPVFAYEQDDFVPWLYCAKASRREREAGLEGMEARETWRHNQDGRDTSNPKNVIGAGAKARMERGEPAVIPSRNTHPCVKPLTLMSWLCRLVTPPGGVVLDPFTGSGSTGCAALREGFRFIGVEREAEYIEIARRRLEYTLSQRPAVTQARLAV